MAQTETVRIKQSINFKHAHAMKKNKNRLCVLKHSSHNKTIFKQKTRSCTCRTFSV